MMNQTCQKLNVRLSLLVSRSYTERFIDDKQKKKKKQYNSYLKVHIKLLFKYLKFY